MTVGIFDSGMGGLSVLSRIRDRLPHIDVVYFGDTLHAPYGEKTREEIRTRALYALTVLQDAGAELFVSACNSISINLDDALVGGRKVIEMVLPATDALMEREEKHILLCATPVTIESGMYQSHITSLEKTVEVLPLIELAGMIERGVSHLDIEQYLRIMLTKDILADIDMVFLGCTHYPLVYDLFRHVIPEHITIFDPADKVGEVVASISKDDGEGRTAYLLSKESVPFRTYVQNKKHLQGEVQIV